MTVFVPTANSLDAVHSLSFTLADGRTYWAMTGAAIVSDAVGGPDWVRSTIDFSVGYPDLPNGNGAVLEHWTVFATPNSVGRNASGGKMGFAVDSFWLTDPGPAAHRSASLHVAIAVREPDLALFRVGFSFAGIGRLGEMTTHI